MKIRGLVLGSMLLVLMTACGPEPTGEERTEETSSALDIPINAPLIDPSSITITFQFQPPTGWQSFAQELDFVTKPFRIAAQTISAISGIVSAAEVVLRFLNLIPNSDPIQALAAKIDQLGVTLTWLFNAQAINDQLNRLQSGLQQIELDEHNNIAYLQSDPTWAGQLDAMNILENTAGISPAFYRNFAEALTDSNTSWKYIIGASAGLTRPVTNTLTPAISVYDWRLHVAALLRSIPERSMILAAVDGNYRTDHMFDNLLGNDLAALFSHYQQMYGGVVCGSRDALGFPGRAIGCQLACADMYTGLSSSKNYLGSDPNPSSGPVTNNFCENLAATPDFKYSALEMRTGVAKQIPFFAVRALVDTLHRTLHPAPDLTEINQRISLEADQNLCVELESGNAADGTPLWLAPCNGSTLQWWTYDRASGRIWNPGLNKCMSALLANRAAQSTPMAAVPAIPRAEEHFGEPISYYVYPAVVATCDDTLPEQKWTFDPDRKVLQNGSGPDTSLTAATTGVHAALAVRGIIGQPQWARSNNQWHADTTAVANNHPQLVASGPVAGGGMALDGQSVYWGSNDGTVQKTNMGATLTPIQVASGQSAPWAVVTDAKNVYWTNFSIPGNVMKSAKSGNNPGVPPTPLTLSADAGRPAGIAVDANYVYYTTSTYGGGPGTIKRMGLDGSGLVTLVTGQVDPEYIAVDATNIYWTNYSGSGGGTVMKGGKNPGDPMTVLASGQTGAMDLRVDATSVYWTANGQILKVSRNGGTPVVLATNQAAPNLAVDSSGVYWVNNYSGGAVMTVGLNGGTPTVLAGGLKSPYLTVLDSTYVYFATNDSPGRLERVAKIHSNVVATPAAPAACAPGPAPMTLLTSGQGLVAFSLQSQITTCDGQWWLALQSDGNLVLYQNVNGAGTPRWASNTVGTFADHATMQADGNFVLYNASGGVVWQSDTAGHPGAYLVTNGQGTLAVSNGTTGFWGTGTPTSPSRCGQMNPGEGLRTGMSFSSCNGRYLLTMQNDGNLVLYDNDTGGALWASGTSGSQLYAWMTTTALYIYQAGAPFSLWASNSPPSPIQNAFLSLSDTGIITVYNMISAFPLNLQILTQTSNSNPNSFGSFATGMPYWTGITTTGQPPVSCTGNSAVNGLGCFGSNCASITLQCATPPVGASINTANKATSGWFSEEGSTTTQTQHMTYSDGTSYNISDNQNQAFCGSAGVMTGVECSGSLCDNVRITCSKLSSGHLTYTAPTASPGQCMWTPYYSEEEGPRAFPSAFTVNGQFCGGGYCELFVNGVECKDGYCDNMRFYLCPVTP